MVAQKLFVKMPQGCWTFWTRVTCADLKVAINNISSQPNKWISNLWWVWLISRPHIDDMCLQKSKKWSLIE